MCCRITTACARIAGVLFLCWSCVPEQPVESGRLALESTPTISIVAPADMLYLELTGAGTPVTMVYNVLNWTPFPGTGKEIRFYVDGQLSGSKVSGTSFTFPAVTMGLHTLSAQLMQDGQVVPHDSAVASRRVRIISPCQTKLDCEEGNPCSVAGCVFAGDGKYECHWQVLDDCCFTLFDCPFGTPYCQDVDSDGTPQCAWCLSDDQCDDGNACSQDQCEGGQCVNLPKAQSCAKDTQCDDSNICTLDWCDALQCQCHHDPAAGCCNADAECDDGVYCTLDRCLGHVCRHGPAFPGIACCLADDDCEATSPCDIAVCQMNGEAGTCTSTPDPAQPGCCQYDQECQDLSDKWIGKCTFDPELGFNSCGHFLTPEWCQTPQGNLVVNEFMADPTEVADALGEWVELYNSSDVPLDLTGFTLSGQDWESCTLFPQGGPMLAPASFLVVGRSADPAVNGGVNVQFSCGPNLSLENSADTITLSDPEGDVVDDVTYDATFPLLPGASLARKNPYLEAGTASSWNPSASSYGTAGQLGTPGAHNLDAGALAQSPVCDDKDPCTLDVCSAQKLNFCSHLTLPLCCNDVQDCQDWDVCTQQECSLMGQCHWDPLPACCSDNSECDDADECTNDACINHVCRHGPIVPGKTCCQQDSDCTSLNPCKTGACQGMFCQLQNLPDCCLAPSQCSDGLKCTQDICDPEKHTCSNQPIPGCCEKAQECEEVKPVDYFCKTAWCIAGQCKYGPNAPGCCALPAHCDDNDDCTWDMCNTQTHTCVNEPKVGCCSANTQCPDDGDPCTLEICSMNTCKAVPQDNCCQTDQECQGGNKCAAQLCLNNRCRTIPSGGAGCCFFDSQCPSDGLPCTVDKCQQLDCVHEVLDPCTLKLNFLERFDAAFDLPTTGFKPYYPGDQTGAPDWTVSVQGLLGPDKHLRLQLVPGERACIATPQLDPKPGSALMTVAADLGLETQQGTVTLFFLTKKVSQDAWIQQWTGAYSKNAAFHKNFEIPLDGPSGTLFQAAFCAEAQTTPATVHLDSVAAAVGTPPQFGPFTPSVAVQRGTVAQRVVRASDPDFETLLFGLSFSLKSAPSWAGLDDYKYVKNLKMYQTRLTLAPPAKTSPDVYKFQIRVSDGFLHNDLPVSVAVMDTACNTDGDCWTDNACQPVKCDMGKCLYSSLKPCCGNGITEQTEQCDDGNGDSGDGCSASCTLEDNDWDGIYDPGDNCPAHANPSQADLDGDGIGDVCDADTDGDAVPDAGDNCPDVSNTGQYDNEGDGLGDACDFDDDNDGVGDDVDLCPETPDSLQADNDQDGQGDACDPDDDNDQVPDPADNCPLTSNLPQVDLDGDGDGDACDEDADGDGQEPPWDCDDFNADVYPRWVSVSRAQPDHWRWDGAVALLDDGMAWSASVEGETDQEFFIQQSDLKRVSNDSLDYKVLGAAGALAFALKQDTVGDNMVVWWDGLVLPVNAGEVQTGSFRVHGTRAVWVSGESATAEIMLWKAGLLYQISNNSVIDSAPSLSTEAIAWASAGEIVLYDGVFALPITVDNVLDEEPVVANGAVAWTRRDGPAGKGNIVLFSLASGQLVHIIDDAVEDWNVAMTEFGLAWKRKNLQTGGVDVYFFDGEQTQALSSGAASDIESLAVGSHIVVWVATSESGRQIWAWDGRESVLLDNHLPAQTQVQVLDNRAAWTSAFGPVEARWVCTSVLDVDQDGEPAPAWGGKDCDDNDAGLFPAPQVVNLTQGGALEPSPPELHGGTVVWSAHDGNDREVFYFDGRGVVQLTSNAEPDLHPAVHDGDVVWTRVTDEGTIVWLFTGKNIMPLPGSEGGDFARIWGDRIAWLVKSDSGNHIWTHDLGTGTTSQVTYAVIWLDEYSLHADRVAWATGGSDTDIRIADLKTGALASQGTFLVKDRKPVVFGDRTAWQGLAVNWDLYLHDGDNQFPLAQGPQDQKDAALWNGQTAWVEKDNEHSRIVYRLSDESVATLEVPEVENSQVALWGDTVAWIAGSGPLAELMVRRAGVVTQVTEDDREDRTPRVHGGQVAWLGGEDVMLLKVTCGHDTDEDGFDANADNCPNLYNPNQVDLDKDGLGDTCDWDDDGDGVGDLPDNCPYNPNSDQLDQDADGSGDACDADADGDEFVSLAYGGDDCNDHDPDVFPVWTPQLLSGGVPANDGPEISATTIAWYGKIAGYNQLFINKNGTTLQLTDNAQDDTNPQVAGDRVAWEHDDGNDTEIWIYDGTTITQLTDNDYADRGPRLDENNVVWYGWDGNDYEVFRWQGEKTSQVTVNARNDYHPHVDGNLVVWRGFDGQDYEIFMRKGNANFNISKNETDDGIPVIEGKKAAWSHFDGNDYEIVLWNDENVTQLTDNTVEDLDPSIESGKVVWRRFDGHDHEIVMYTGLVVFQMTDDNMDKGPPKHNSGRVVWSARSQQTDDWEIYTYKAGKVVQVTVNNTQDVSPAVYGDTIVWRCNQGICMASAECGP